MKKLKRIAICAAASVLPAAAQCSMCRTALGSHSGDVFDRAILVLLVPAMALFGGTFLLFTKVRNSDKDSE